MTKITDASQDAARQEAELRDWVLGRVAYYIEGSPEDIDPDAKLVGYGLDSMYALLMCGDIEDEYGLVVDPTLAWDYPTVNAIVGYLASQLSEDSAAAGDRVDGPGPVPLPVKLGDEGVKVARTMAAMRDEEHW
jgi:acyl carrier protein